MWRSLRKATYFELLHMEVKINCAPPPPPYVPDYGAEVIVEL